MIRRIAWHLQRNNTLERSKYTVSVENLLALIRAAGIVVSESALQSFYFLFPLYRNVTNANDKSTSKLVMGPSCSSKSSSEDWEAVKWRTLAFIILSLVILCFLQTRMSWQSSWRHDKYLCISNKDFHSYSNRNQLQSTVIRGLKIYVYCLHRTWGHDAVHEEVQRERYGV